MHHHHHHYQLIMRNEDHIDDLLVCLFVIFQANPIKICLAHYLNKSFPIP